MSRGPGVINQAKPVANQGIKAHATRRDATRRDDVRCSSIIYLMLDCPCCHAQLPKAQPPCDAHTRIANCWLQLKKEERGCRCACGVRAGASGMWGGGASIKRTLINVRCGCYCCQQIDKQITSDDDIEHMAYAQCAIAPKQREIKLEEVEKLSPGPLPLPPLPLSNLHLHTRQLC